jgi:hypothetical protein
MRKKRIEEYVVKKPPSDAMLVRNISVTIVGMII